MIININKTLSVGLNARSNALFWLTHRRVETNKEWSETTKLSGYTKRNPNEKAILLPVTNKRRSMHNMDHLDSCGALVPKLSIQS